MLMMSDFLMSWVRVGRRRRRMEAEDEGILFYVLTINSDTISSSERNQNKSSEVSATPIHGEKSLGDYIVRLID
jgi:hypothetical protein